MVDLKNMTPAAIRILETASELFYWQGIRAVGVETIAKEAGVTKKTIYDRFGSKEELIVAYLKYRDEKWRTFLAENLEKVADNQPEQKILAIFDTLGEWLINENQRGCAFINAFAELSEESHPGRRIIIGEKEWLKDKFINYLEQMNVKNAVEVGERLMVLHEGITVTYSMNLNKDSSSLGKDMALVLIRNNI
ncbi:TetR/AcrR family transcriptional regulator [Paenibacillus lemnae]|uniref:TetR/AcrR family transcriptional regulator n=1 Tax=Paenibacillus lemnae TaxID=1330551 RepID=A0A848M6D6_PAELE|nr:TetR/AcrR family transcriptional regulator [Paenibacillus lemnae]NMO95750.1 TetR/AcrR family transcriptional regulator [Paenibacillus lemnae]